MSAEICSKLKAILCIAMLAGAEVSKLRHDAIKNVDRKGSFASSANVGANHDVRNSMMQTMTLDSKSQEHRALFKETLTPEPNSLEQANHIAKQTATIMADPRFQERASLVAEKMDAIMTDQNVQQRAKLVAEQMEAMLTDSNLQGQAKLVAYQLQSRKAHRSFQVDAERFVNEVETLMADPNLQERTKALSGQVEVMVGDLKVPELAKLAAEQLEAIMAEWDLPVHVKLVVGQLWSMKPDLVSEESAKRLADHVEVTQILQNRAKLRVELAEAVMAAPSLQERAKLFAERSKKLWVNLGSQDHLKLVAESATAIINDPIVQERAKRALELIEAMMVDPAFHDQATDFANRIEALMTNLKFQRQASGFEDRLDGAHVDPKSSEQAKLVAERLEDLNVLERLKNQLANLGQSALRAASPLFKRSDSMANNFADRGAMDGSTKSIANRALRASHRPHAAMDSTLFGKPRHPFEVQDATDKVVAKSADLGILIDKLSGKSVDRTLKASPLHPADLHETTLGFSSRLEEGRRRGEDFELHDTDAPKNAAEAGQLEHGHEHGHHEHAYGHHGHAHGHHGHAHGPVHGTLFLFDAVSCACKQCSSLRTGRSRSRSGSLLKPDSGQQKWGGHSHDPAEHVGDSGTTETAWNIINLVIGGGVLSMPYVCKLSGWLGIAIIAATAAVFAFNAIVVGAILRQQHDWFEHHKIPKEARDYVLVAKLAFGTTGAWLTALISVLENWSAAICYLIFVGTNVRIVTGLPVSIGIVISGALSLVMLYMPLKLLSYFGVIGMFCAAGAVSTLVAQGMLSDSPASHVNFNPGGAATAGGVAFFCFAGHACLPNVYWSMRHPKEKYAKACASAYTTIFAFYGLTAALGYYFFGNSLTNSFTASLTSQKLLLPAIAAILMKVQVAVPPNLAPPLIVIENMLGLRTEVHKFVSRCTLVGLSILLAVFWRDALTQLVAVSGYLMTGYDSLILPSLIAVKLGTGTRLRPLHAMIAMSGVLVCIGGTYVSLAGL